MGVLAPELLPLSPDELVRSGLSVRVTMRAAEQAALGAAARELRRHLRVAAFLGALFPAESGPAWETARSLFRYDAHGFTWRAAGSEYTVRQLHAACASAFSAAGGRGSLELSVSQVSGAAAGLAFGLADSSDPRSGGIVDRAAETGGRVVEGAVSTVEGLGSAAGGVGALAAGVGEGALGAGGLAREFPAVAFVTVAALGLLLLFRGGRR